MSDSWLRKIHDLLDPSAVPYYLSVAAGNIEGQSIDSGFGHAPGLNLADGFGNIWEGAGNANANALYGYSSIADIDTISSSDNSDVMDVVVVGFDADYLLVTQTVTLVGQAKATLSTPLFRVKNITNFTATPLVGSVYCYVDGAITAGVPNTPEDVRAIIEIGNETTLMGSFLTIPAGKTGYILLVEPAVSKKQTAVVDLKPRLRLFGGLFLTFGLSGMNTSGTSRFATMPVAPILVPEKTDIEFLASTDKDGTGVSVSIQCILIDN